VAYLASAPTVRDGRRKGKAIRLTDVGGAGDQGIGLRAATNGLTAVWRSAERFKNLSEEDVMGLFDNALQGAVPGGNLAAPIAVAAGALLLGKFLSGGSSPAVQGGASAPAAPTTPQSGGLFSGLNDLVQKFQDAGHGDVINSWVGSGPNQPVQPTQIGAALGQQTISDLARKAGLNEQDLLNQLAQTLPGLIDKLSPNGRLPTQAELAAQGH
jgi:uncharacterized protein YidB (DUF937 family)